MEPVFIFVLAIAALLFVFSLGAYIELMLLAKSPLKPADTTNTLSTRPFKTNDAVYPWTKANDFEFFGTFTIGHYTLNTWKHLYKPTCLCLHTFPDRGIELITVFEKDIIFCTVNNSNWHGSPHFPGYYLQTFSKISIDELWHRHLQMEDYLEESGKVKLSDSEIDIEDCLDTYRKRQTRHIRSFTAWPARLYYWNLIGKHSWHNKTLKTQYEKGMIQLPHEVLF